ncbi:MerR family transcriptional regulator [Magnetospirillum sp. 64-120]|uniref:MerR family transcriptional regulator n=1 Tax=Magnetospirillum sp. 64-120 TaxID=1895778 RepID=UPI000926EA62|nr:MerR family transcriptional regulator [Magnetospirillum sp. 64-120]OJX78547.1 MAG: hypothetical protein BGO92_01455 [Magnetospirillum sp. 64-120]
MGTDEDTYSVSEIARAIGEKPRAVQFWADMGVLQPEGDTYRKGKGVHRRFSTSELQYAYAASYLAGTNAPLSEILAAVGRLRRLTPERLVEAPTQLAEKIKSGADVDKFDVANAYIEMMEIGAFYSSLGEGSHIIIVYHKVNDEVVMDVRFWFKRIAEAFKNDMAKYASFALHNVIGFKAIRFDDIANTLEAIQGYRDREELRRVGDESFIFSCRALIESTAFKS